VLAYRISHHGGPTALEWVELPKPEPRPDEVLVQVRACALNRLDLWLREGVEGHEFPLPLIPGSEIAGDIAGLGVAAEDLETGHPVLIAPGISCGLCERCVAGQDHLCRQYGIFGETRDGGYAEYVVVPRRNVLPLPSSLSYVEAAAVPLVFQNAWHMLTERARLEPHEDILIHAAGSGVSSAGIQIARLLGARHIIATAGGPEKLERARELGATHALDYTRDDFVREVRRITDGKGVEVVFDHVGGSTFEQSLRCIAWGGRLVLCGATAGHLATVNLRAVFFKNLSILGSTMGTLSELIELLRFFDTGQLRPVIDRVLPLEQAPEAQATLERREAFGKIVLTVGDPEVARRSPGATRVVQEEERA
jgi:NADPH:quinone reductase-like Zn-dependent oxidoreductase